MSEAETPDSRGASGAMRPMLEAGRGAGRTADKGEPPGHYFYCCSVLRRLAIVSVEVAPAQTRTLSITPGK